MTTEEYCKSLIPMQLGKKSYHKTSEAIKTCKKSQVGKLTYSTKIEQRLKWVMMGVSGRCPNLGPLKFTVNYMKVGQLC